MVKRSSFFFEPYFNWYVRVGQTTIMKNIFLIISLTFSSITILSQTKLISHKSHSGSSQNFKKSINGNLFNIGASNFGMAPQRFVRNSSLDTVKLLSPNVAIMITSETCRWEDYDSRGTSTSELWSAGTDTVYDHPVFNSKNSIPEMKMKLKREYYFANAIDSVVFIGFDGNYAKIEKKKQNSEELKTHEVRNHEDDFSKRKRPSLFIVILFSLFTTIFRTPF